MLVKQPAPNTVINSVLIVHESTTKHLDLIEKVLLDALINQGRAKIVPDTEQVKV